MIYSFRQSSLAAVSLAVIVAAATPTSPAMAQSTRDKVFATIVEATKAAGAKEYTWGEVSGTDAEFTVSDTKITMEQDGKSSTVSADKAVYTNAKPTADGGFTADQISATDVEFESDDSSLSIDSLKITGYVGQAPEKIRAKTTPGERFDKIEATGLEVTDENDKTIPIAAMTVTAADFTDGVPRKVGFDMKGLEVPIDATDESMKDIADLGYTKLTLDASFTGNWDDKTGRVTIDQLSIAGADLGGLKLSLAMGGLTPTVVEALKKSEGDQAKQMELLQGLTVEKLSLRYEDASLAKRLLDDQAKKQGLPADALVKQLDAMVPMMISTIGNKDFEKKISTAASAFLKAPKSLTVSATPAKPMPVAEIMGAAMMAPQSLPTVLGADVTAND